MMCDIDRKAFSGYNNIAQQGVVCDSIHVSTELYIIGTSKHLGEYH